MANLKVYRTPIGFHDAYVAAPSKKAALKAWGSEANLFARGVAELVTDPALTADPLARPGEVIRRLRGSPAEQLAAAGKSAPRASSGTAATVEGSARTARKPPPATRPKPRPARATLTAAEDAVIRAETLRRAEEKRFSDEIEVLSKAREAMRAGADRELAALERARAAIASRYEAAVAKWRKDG